MALYHKWNVKNGFAYVLQFFSLISDGLGGVQAMQCSSRVQFKIDMITEICMNINVMNFDVLLGSIFRHTINKSFELCLV